MTDKRSEYLRKTYQSKGMKKGISLQLLEDVDKVLTKEQRMELRDVLGVTTLEELYELYHRTPNLSDSDFTVLKVSDLEKAANACDKYFSEEEKNELKQFYKKFGTGALNPEDYKKDGEKND